MFLISTFFKNRDHALPSMQGVDDILLHPQHVIGVYISGLNGKPRRLIRFAALDKAITTRITRYNDPDLSFAARKNAWRELEALRQIRSNITNHVYTSITLTPDADFQRSLIPHLRHIILSAERDFKLLGISMDDPRKIGAFKKLIRKHTPKSFEFAKAARNTGTLKTRAPRPQRA